eukprot:Opistho-2@90789
MADPVSAVGGSRRVIKEGFVLVKSKNVMKPGWISYRFVEPGIIKYNRAHEADRVSALAFDVRSQVKEHDVGRANSWEMTIEDKTFQCATDTLAEKMQWLKVLLFQISSASGSTDALSQDKAGHIFQSA